MSPPDPEVLPLAYADPRGEGTPILFVHGFSHNREVWQKQASRMPPAFRPICVDLRGHGESPWSPPGRYDLRDYALDLPALLDCLDIDRAHVVGHSLGGNVCTLFGSAHPERVASLALIDTGPALEGAGSLHVAEEVGSALRTFESEAEFREALGLIHPHGDREILDRLAARSVVERLDGRFEPALDPGVLAGGPTAGQISEMERMLWGALHDLRCPVLVVRGGQSAILSEKVAREMVEEVLVDGRLRLLESAGHAVMIDDGDGLDRVLMEFLGSV